MSSSGLVWPSGRSVREAQVTGRSCAAPLLASSKVPEPSCRFPLHTTLARRSALAIHASNTSVSTDTKSLPAAPALQSCVAASPGSLAPAPFAGSGLFQLAHVDLFGLRRTYLDPFAARNLSEQRSGLAQGGLHIEVVEAGNAVPGNYDVEPPHGCTGRRVVDTDVGDRATDDQRIHVPQAQHMLQTRAVEGVVAWLAYGRLVFVGREPVHH